MKAVRLLIGVIALVLVVVGVAVAIVLGPDDTWGGEPAVLPDSAPVIATTPQLLNVAGAELRVSATTDEGEAFVGAGHPVHVQDYVRDVERTEITQLSADGVGAMVRLKRPGARSGACASRCRHPRRPGCRARCRPP